MRNLLFLVIALFSLFASRAATAADIVAPVYKAPPPPVYSWTGFYVDGGLGYGAWTADTTVVAGPLGLAVFGVPPGTCLACPATVQGGKGFVGTLGGGYDYQFSDHVVAGVLADWDFSSIQGSIQDATIIPLAGNLQENWSWAVGARIGWLITPAILPYINGGYTQAHFTSASMQLDPPVPGLTSPLSTPAFSDGGWFVGAGMEASLSSMVPGLFARLEYRYADYGKETLPDTCPANLFVPFAPLPGSGLCRTFGAFLTPFNSITFQPTVQTITAGLVYKFNWSR